MLPHYEQKRQNSAVTETINWVTSLVARNAGLDAA
jgi:hypothetical protein